MEPENLEKKELELEDGKVSEEQPVARASDQDANLVDWDGEDDPANPQNWSSAQSWAITLIVAVFSLTASISSSMLAPCLPAIAADLHITNDFVSQMVLSAYVLSWGIGPLIMGPLSEIYGRAIVLQVSNIVYLAFNLACGFSQNAGEMIAFRILSGLGGSAPLAIGDGVLGDIWPREELGKAIAIEGLVSLVGPAIGPIMGGFVVTNTTWRWTCYATSIATGVIAIGGFCTLRETYAPFLLREKARQLQKATGNPNLYTKHELNSNGLLSMIGENLFRPLKLLLTQPIIQVIAVYSALLYGLIYLVLSTFSSIWVDFYGEGTAISGLHYIAIALGLFLGTQAGAPLNDRLYVGFKRRHNGSAVPEYHLPLLIPACLLVAVGFFGFGWAVEKRSFWIGPDVCVAVLSAGSIVSFICVQTYIIDAYPRYAASAMSTLAFARALAGFGFPLFAPYMYSSLGYGWSGTLLGFLALFVGVPTSLLFWRYGGALRVKSPFAQG